MNLPQHNIPLNHKLRISSINWNVKRYWRIRKKKIDDILQPIWYFGYFGGIDSAMYFGTPVRFATKIIKYKFIRMCKGKKRETETPTISAACYVKFHISSSNWQLCWIRPVIETLKLFEFFFTKSNFHSPSSFYTYRIETLPNFFEHSHSHSNRITIYKTIQQIFNVLFCSVLKIILFFSSSVVATSTVSRHIASTWFDFQFHV